MGSVSFKSGETTDKRDNHCHWNPKKERKSKRSNQLIAPKEIAVKEKKEQRAEVETISMKKMK